MGDDHIQFQIKNISRYSSPLFAQFISDCDIGIQKQNKQLLPKIVFSIDPRLNIGDLIVKINNKIPFDFAKKRLNDFGSKTDSFDLAIKKIFLDLSIFNPLNLVTDIVIQKQNGQQKNIKLKYVQGLPSYFKKYNASNINDYIQKQIIGKPFPKITDYRIFEQARTIMIELHEFPMFGDKLNTLIEALKIANSDNINLICLDFRRNFGGSPIGLFFIVQLLLQRSLVKYIAICRNNNYIVNQQFLQEYKNQFIMPILNDSSSDQHLKYFLRRQLKEFEIQSKKQNNFKINADSKQCKYKESEALIKKIIKKTKNLKNIAIITDYACFSACVWSVNFLKLFPNVVVIGKSTGKTTGSGNALEFTLPSKMGVIYMPQIKTELIGTLQKNVINKSNKADIKLPESIIDDTENLLIWLFQNQSLINKKITQKVSGYQ